MFLVYFNDFPKFQFSGFNILFPDPSRRFCQTYKCYSVSMLPGNERNDVENGGKSNEIFEILQIILCVVFFLVIMPPSALDQLTRLNIEYPMLFKITNKKSDRITHSGVLEFVADEGKIYIPYWVSFKFQFQSQISSTFITKFILDDAQLVARRGRFSSNRKCVTSRSNFLKISTTKCRLSRYHKSQGSFRKLSQKLCLLNDW